MAGNLFGRLAPSSRGTRSFYEELRSHDDADLEEGAGLNVDEENFRQQLSGFDAEALAAGDSRLTVDSAAGGGGHLGKATRQHRGLGEVPTRWPVHDDELDSDVPASLLVEPNDVDTFHPGGQMPENRQPQTRPPYGSGNPGSRSQLQWDDATAQQRLHQDEPRGPSSMPQPRSLMRDTVTGGRREKSLWRWANTSSLDTFIRDVYHYYEGCGLLCILCSNALWLLETLFVAVLLTFLTQCIDYTKVPHSKSLNQVVIKQCTRNMSGLWSFGIWLYSFFFIWKSVQYFFEIRRLIHIRDFYVYLLEIPEQDMQTVSWQDIVARIMTLRDQNPKTAMNMPQNLRRFIGSQSKERLDAHDIANRLMRKENYLIAMINKDVLNLSLPLPLLRGRQLFSKTMEWYLHYGIIDMAFNELGQVRQDFLRADRRGILSQKLKQRLYFAGLLNLVFAPVVLAYVIIVYFFTYYNEYQKDPKLAAARKYTALAEWKFREFNELPHIFYERLHMSFPFATRYIDQFPKRMTEEIARSISFMSGAITAVLAVCTVLDSELFLGFEITKDRTVLFYLGVFGGIWAMTRGMISEETSVFNPEYALRNVIEYTHYMPDHWNGRLHSFEVKKEFSELYKMKVLIFLEEVMGIITTPMLLLFSLPKCSEQIVDFFREFTIHVDGLGYVCSFAVFDFKKGIGRAAQQGRDHDVREDYYSTKHGKMAASYYGFLDNYVINPKTGIPGHMPPGVRQQFHPPPAFPSLNSPTLAADMQGSHIIEEAAEDRASEELDGHEVGGILGESTWETSPGQDLSRENSAANAEEPEAGVLGLIYQLRQTQHSRRGGVV
ncbi:autophagy protein apg9 domain-containing protein [Hirsutella rhossiliensis]|uniref:Autophagy-related protein 9 n=1 Tax=Hirsutella rhossiliensis TaxID=111463 RepID=A0A9P8MKF3_9HYPO|nr:autophagy protein apg9 domain-containing protein [Hirsutella rhossiliensis]KAH0957958.1 autophagy protein apg9 domain-containing protein [Hirsutella rhossiliensis]